MIRKATIDDVKSIMVLARECFCYLCKNENFTYNEERTENVIRNSIVSDDTVIFVIENNGIQGYFFGGVFDLYYGFEIVGKQISWYVSPEYRGTESIKLAKEFEKWCFSKKCSHVFLDAPINQKVERMSKLMDRLGYHPHEIAFRKVNNE